VLSANNIGEQKVDIDKKSASIENIRSTDVQDRLLREFFQEKNVDEKILERVMEINRRLQIAVDQEEFSKGVNWKIEKLAWNNLFNYGEGNVIDFSKLGGLIGLFAPNGSGKSNFIDVILETCFDQTTKGVNKNLFLVNDNKSSAAAIMEITANDRRYEVVRQIEKIKYGHRKGSAKEWGKTTVDFASVDETGERQQHVEEQRSGTEKNIRQCFGTYEDFLLTSLFAQWNPLDIIKVKETERKKIIYRFLDLEFFGKKDALAKDEHRVKSKQLEEIESVDLENVISKLESSLAAREDELDDLMAKISAAEEVRKEKEDFIVEIVSKKKSVEKITMRRWESCIEELDQKAQDKNSELLDLQKQIAEVESVLFKLNAIKNKFDKKLHEQKKQRHDDVCNEIVSLNGLLRDLEKDLAANKKNAILLDEVPCGDTFKTCKFLSNAFRSRDNVKQLSDKITDVDKIAAALEEEKKSLEHFVLKFSEFELFMEKKKDLESKQSSLILHLDNTRLQLDNLNNEKDAMLNDKLRFEKMESDIRENLEIEQAVHELQNEKKEIENKIRLLQAKTLDISKKLGSDQGILKKLNEQLSLTVELKNACQAYELFHRAMGKDGIPHRILAQKLPLINDEINKILSSVADFGVFLEHDEEEQSIRFFIQYGNYKSRLLELGGGAEKFIASMAIRCALLSISVLPKSNIFMIDEGFGKLDPKNLENVLKMFDYLKTVFEHVIVISHLDTMKDVVDNFIEIVSDEEGYAHVSVGDE